MLAIISFAVLFSYTVYYLLRVGLLPSHSDSYLALGKQGWNTGGLATLMQY